MALSSASRQSRLRVEAIIFRLDVRAGPIDNRTRLITCRHGPAAHKSVMKTRLGAVVFFSCTSVAFSTVPHIDKKVLLFGLFAVHFAGAAEDVFDSVVALVAGVFVNWSRRSNKGILHGPGLRPGGWVVDGDAIEDGVPIDAAEALDGVRILGRAIKPGLVGEIRGIDH